MLCVAATGLISSPRCVGPAPYDESPRLRNRWSQVNEPGNGKATRMQVAGLWIAASSLALALLRTALDVLEVLGR
jgi:hypothetical protein